MKHTLSICLVLTLLFSLCVPAMAAEDAAGTTLRLEKTTGTVAVKDAAGMDKSARTGMRLYNGYTVETGASSSAYISLDETKAVKLDASAEAEIKKQGKKLEVAVTAGQLFFNVTEPLKTDESLNIRTATMVTGIRGSFGWVNGNQMGLLHGHVTLSCINPETGETRMIDVHSGEMVSYDQASSQSAESSLQEIGFVKEAITVEAVPAIAAEEVANSETLQAQLSADTTAVTVTELVESLPEKQAEEKAAETAAQAQVEAAVSAQEQAITAAAAADALSETTLGGTGQAYADLSANTPTATDSGSSGGGDSSGDGSSGGGSSGGGSSSGGGGGSAAPAPAPASVTVYNADEIQSALNSYTIVTYAWGETSTNQYIDPISTLTIPSGKTLIIGDGTVSRRSRMLLITSSMTNRGTVTIQSGSTLDFSGDASVTCDNYGTINLYGSIFNASNGTFNNYGTVNNYSR